MFIGLEFGKMAKAPDTLKDLKTQLEEAKVRADLADARARKFEAAYRAKHAKLMTEAINQKNIKDFQT